MKFLLSTLTALFFSSNVMALEPADSTKTKEKKLKTATVVAQRRAVKADAEKLAYDVAADPSNKTQNVLEMLRKVPMVTVDGDDNIKVKGSSSFKVYVDGKPNTMMSSDPSKILKNYPAEAVSKIEVITDPGAKYDGEGVAGILNIITNKKMYTNGWTLTPDLKLGTEEQHGGFSGMAKLNKLTLSAYTFLGIGKQKATKASSDYIFKNTPDLYSLTTSGSAKPKYNYQIGALEGSYEFDEHNLLSVSAGLHSVGIKYGYDQLFTMSNQQGKSVYSYNRVNSTRQRMIGLNASTDFQHSFNKEGELLTLSYRFSSDPSLNRTNTTFENITGEQYISSTLTNQKIRPDNDSYEHTAQLDFTTPTAKGQTFNAGLKFIGRNNESDTKEWDAATATSPEWLINEAKSLNYRHLNNIYAAYMEYSLKKGKWGATAGLRYEYDHINVRYLDGKRSNFHKDLSDLLPSVKLSYNLSESELLKLTFNSRIGRPSIDMLSPYVTDNDGLNISYGNPNMNSERGYNVTLGYGKFGQKFSINAELGGQVNNNGLTSYKFLDSKNIINETYDNFLHQRAAILSLYINWMCTHTTSLTLNGEGGYMYYAVQQINARNDGWGGSANIQVQQRLPWKVRASLYAGYFSKSPNLQGTTHAFQYNGLSFSRSFLKEDRLTITLGGNFLVFPTVDWKEYKETDDYISRSSMSRNAMSFSIDFSWRLGKLKASVKKAKRTISNDDAVSTKSNKGNNMGNVGM